MDPGFSTADWAVLISGFGGAVFGALVGGAISLVLARQASAETLRRDDEGRKAQLASQALKLMIKMSLVLSDAQSISAAINGALASNKSKFPTEAMKFQIVPPVLMDFHTYDVDADELQPLLATKENDLFSDAVNSIMQHREVVASLKRYNKDREALKTRVPPQFFESERIGSTLLNEEQRTAVQPLFLALETTLDHVLSMLPRLESQAGKVTSATGPAMRRKLGLPDFPIMQVVARTDEKSE